MIDIPIWFFVILCVCLGIVGLLVLTIIIEAITELVYQKYEMSKYKSKEKENGRK